MKFETDILIIGAGAIGCSTALAAAKRNKGKIIVLEKEKAPALHTSGRNSGVVHSGFNPKPGTLKARLCVNGARTIKELCITHRIPFAEVGTLVVAQNEQDIPTLEELLRRGKANDVPDIRIISSKELLDIEPHATGIAALLSPSGAITDSTAVTKAIAEQAQQQGCEFKFDEDVDVIEELNSEFLIKTKNNSYRTQVLINCAGLHADEIAHKLQVGMSYSIVPFRGEYYRIEKSKQHILNSMLYPVPDLNYPFLGVHWTKKISGESWIGPNATLAWGREAYQRLQIMGKDTFLMMKNPAFWKMFLSREFRNLAWDQLQISLSKKRFVEEAKKLIPHVSAHEFSPARSGIRAQLIDTQGKLVDDMVIEKKGTSLHVLNAVSPGFTCSMAFGEHLIDLI